DYFCEWIVMSFPTRRSSDLVFVLSPVRCPSPMMRTCGFSSIVTERKDLPGFSTLIYMPPGKVCFVFAASTYDLLAYMRAKYSPRSEEHTSELQSRFDLVCRL